MIPEQLPIYTVKELERKAAELLREALPQGIQIPGFGDPQAIKKYLCTKAAQLFEVSPQAMSFRLGEWPTRINDRVDAAIDARLETHSSVSRLARGMTRDPLPS